MITSYRQLNIRTVHKQLKSQSYIAVPFTNHKNGKIPKISHHEACWPRLLMVPAIDTEQHHQTILDYFCNKLCNLKPSFAIICR